MYSRPRALLRRTATALALGALVAAVLLTTRERGLAGQQRSLTLRDLAERALTTLERTYYAGRGGWRDCPQPRCAVHNNDWGSDALTATLYLHWKTHPDSTAARLLTELSTSARTYAPSCLGGPQCELWSDAPLWDAVADVHEYDGSRGAAAALAKAEAAFWAVEGSPVYGIGACPSIRYQRPYGRGDRLKTLETDANGIKAAILLYGITREGRYLVHARERYAAVRTYFLDATLPLYSTYVFDDGTHCVQVPHHFFASVNGTMIWNGLQLARLTHDGAYRFDALATARAVVSDLSDARGVFANLQAENDVAEPLVEAMLDVASEPGGAFARTWLLANAAAAASARRDDGSYGRLFDGPPPHSAMNAWQTNGGLAVVIAAASLAPDQRVALGDWRDARFVRRDVAQLPVTIRFFGSGFALIGPTHGVCCAFGHARVYVDHVETINHVGIWQNISRSTRQLPDNVLFAWRWKTNGAHSVTFTGAPFDAKQGGPFLRAHGYLVLATPATARHPEPAGR